ncbi:MAG: 30S ribosomal protein S9 [Tissierellaceae bacterium]
MRGTVGQELRSTIITEQADKFEVLVNVECGGFTGQVRAIRKQEKVHNF